MVLAVSTDDEPDERRSAPGHARCSHGYPGRRLVDFLLTRLARWSSIEAFRADWCQVAILWRQRTMLCDPNHRARGPADS